MAPDARLAGEPLDVVYYVRPGERNDELRYSLRSLSNVPHGRVWIVGHKPRWVRGVEYVKGNMHGTVEGNAVGNLALACQHVGQARFVVFNDDFYVVQPIDRIPSLHAGPLAQRIASARTTYRRQLLAAADLLASLGKRDLLAWTLHVPVVVRLEWLRLALRLIGTRRPIPEWRTVYGNLWGVAGEQAPDVKVRQRSDEFPMGPFLSTQDATLSAVAPRLARLFPNKSEYEA